MEQSVKKELLAGLKEAMMAERNGHEFYKMAAKSTLDPATRGVFEQLAKEELEHFNFLASQYKAVLETEQVAQDVKLTHTALHDDSPIISPELRLRIREAHFEMSALNIAAQLELNAVNRYRDLSNKAQLPEVAAFYGELLAWESTHYFAFRSQLQAIQGEYWSQYAIDESAGD